ncbi:MAG: hypothetical protein QOE93_2003, partial [Actinomycetota bacterium]|nr:hypothetical protein [Actinomycetota bacterium]
PIDLRFDVSTRSRARAQLLHPAHVGLVVGAGLLVVAANRLGSAEGVVQPRIVIAVALLVITCGQIALWPRRDNVFAYRQAGIYFTTLFIPLVGTATLTDYQPHILDLYARVLAIGAIFFAGGLALGGHFASRTRPRFTFTFGQSLAADGPAWRLLRRRTRIFTAMAAVALLGSFALLRYVPLLAENRQFAKYGIGIYGPGFARGRLVYHFALAIAGVVFPLSIIVAYRSRAFLDLALCGAVAMGLTASLSRGDAFAGPLLVLIAFAIGRKVAPTIIVAGVCVMFLGGALANEFLFSSVKSAPTLPARLAASAPDVRDHLAFLTGFEREGSRPTHGRTLFAKLSSDGGEFDPAAYAIRLTTGITETHLLASGGIRLPAPLWGFASFGFPGAAGFCLVSGLFIGWGTVRVRNAVTARRGDPHYWTNLLLGAVFFDGTFAFMATFFFAPFADVVVFGVAVMVGLMPWAWVTRRTDGGGGDGRLATTAAAV